MKLEVSIGEAVDKLSILELKRRFIEDDEKRHEIEKEIISLSPQCEIYKNNYYRILMYVNEKIWTLTNTIKNMNYDTELAQFAQISNQIFEYNQKRFRIKNIFNYSQNSELKEQKSYSKTTAYIYVHGGSDEIYRKIPEIMYLLTEYDILYFSPEIFHQSLEKLFPIALKSGAIAPHDATSPPLMKIILADFQATDYEVFSPEPITYRTVSLFGDFIHQLSVVNEKFLETGRKGIVYLYDGGNPFRNGTEGTYKDTFDLITRQIYIKEYKIYNGEPFDVCLGKWRDYISLDSWHDIYQRAYNVDWGRHIWLDVPYDGKWKDKIIINRPEYKPMTGFSVEAGLKLLEFSKKTGKEIVFLSYNISDYNHFKSTFQIEMEYYCPTSCMDMCSAIKSCFFFFGALSGSLTIAHACRTNRMVLSFGEDSADFHETKMTNIWKNVYFNMDDAIEKMRMEV